MGRIVLICSVVIIIVVIVFVGFLIIWRPSGKNILNIKKETKIVSPIDQLKPSLDPLSHSLNSNTTPFSFGNGVASGFSGLLTQKKPSSFSVIDQTSTITDLPVHETGNGTAQGFLINPDQSSGTGTSAGFEE